MKIYDELPLIDKQEIIFFFSLVREWSYKLHNQENYLLALEALFGTEVIAKIQKDKIDIYFEFVKEKVINNLNNILNEEPVDMMNIKSEILN